MGDLIKKIIFGFFIILLLCVYMDKKKDYGVFIGLEQEKIELLSSYKSVMIDAEYYSKKI